MALVDDVLERLRSSRRSGSPHGGRLDQVAEALETRLQEALASETPAVVIGKTGVGKTSTVNALFGTSWHVSHTTVGTLEPQSMVLDSRQRRLRVSDLPGFADDIDEEELRFAEVTAALEACDVALLILKADTRDMAEVQRMLRGSVAESTRLSSKLVVGLNQVDLVHPGDWHSGANLPSEEQEANIAAIAQQRALSIRKVIPSFDEKHVIPYSAAKRYRLAHLFTALLESTSGEAWVLDAKKEISDFRDLVDPKYLG